MHPEEEICTFWDYFRNAWGRNAGLRLDHVLMTSAIADRLCGGGVDRHVRGWEKNYHQAPRVIREGDKPGARFAFVIGISAV